MKVLTLRKQTTDIDGKVEVLKKLWESRVNHLFSDRYPHIIDTYMTQDEWEEMSCPHTWKLLEKNGEFSVLVDTSYWMMFLFRNDELIDYGEHEITTLDVVIMDKEYHSLPKYIWR